MRILIVGEEKPATGKLADYLELQEGLAVCGIAEGAREARRIGDSPETDLIILDIETVTTEWRDAAEYLAGTTVPRILVLTIHPEARPGFATNVDKRIRILSKDRGIDEILRAIRHEEKNDERE